MGIRFLPIEKIAGARLLHDLRPRVAAEITESIRTVDNGVDFCNFGIAQYKVAVCLIGEWQIHQVDRPVGRLSRVESSGLVSGLLVGGAMNRIAPIMVSSEQLWG